METRVELHNKALSLLSLIKAAEAQRTEMLRYNVEVAEPSGLETWTDEELEFKCRVITRLERSYSNVIKELLKRTTDEMYS